MRTLSAWLLAVAAATAICPLCPGAFAGGSSGPTLTVDNHQRLVTVKGANGAWLFARVLSSASVRLVQASQGGDLWRVSLLDAAGKTLWSARVSQGPGSAAVEGGWVDGFEALLARGEDGFKRTARGLGVNVRRVPPLDILRQTKRMEWSIGPQDQILSFRASWGGRPLHHLWLAPVKSGLMTRMDGGPVFVIPPGSLPASGVAAGAPALAR